MRLVWLDPAHVLWPSAQQLVADVFAHAYGADIAHLPDRMLGVLGNDGKLACAVGVRDSHSGFFSECYLDVPVDSAIAAATGKPIFRKDILELTALAASRPGAFGYLLSGLAPAGRSAGYRWGLFTATRPLRTVARRFGARLVELGWAERNRVSDPERWGTYYDHAPIVCAVDGAEVGRTARLRRDDLHRDCNIPKLAASA